MLICIGNHITMKILSYAMTASVIISKLYQQVAAPIPEKAANTIRVGNGIAVSFLSLLLVGFIFGVVDMTVLFKINRVFVLEIEK